jgi:alpha-mannosidase
MHYGSILEQNDLSETIISAAKAAVADPAAPKQTWKTKLQHAFDLLIQARQHYYPVDFYLVDITLVAPTTSGSELVKELAANGPTRADHGEHERDRSFVATNVLTSSSNLEKLVARCPVSLRVLQEAVERGEVGVIGGTETDERLGNLPPEALLSEFLKGRAQYVKVLGNEVTVFAHLFGGTSPLVPQILNNLGYDHSCTWPARSAARCSATTWPP